MKIYLDSIGCRLNQSEIEQFGRQFRKRGHRLTAKPEDADLAVLNTCAVTAKASADSRMKARRLSEHTKDGVVLTGCWSTLDPEIAASIPNIQAVIPNADKDLLVARVLPLDPITDNEGPLAREPLPGVRARTRAFIKVQDGCDLSCTFCVTTIARGAGRSIPTRKIIDDIRYAQRGGAKEAVLTGVHLGSWGYDLAPKQSLKDLIETILMQTDIARIRLSSLEPWDLEEDFFSIWQDRRVCRHLHLPLQSGSDRILRRMSRRTTTEEFAHLVEFARAEIPDLAITTDMIVGFPGESEQDFNQSMELIASLSLAGGHVFTYSEREGTPAARMNGAVHPQLRKQRSAQMRRSFRASRGRFQSEQLGSQKSVLWEAISGSGPMGFDLQGWTDNYIRVQYTSPTNLTNEINRVQLQDFNADRSAIVVNLVD